MKRIAAFILLFAAGAFAQVRVPAGRLVDLTQEISPSSPVFFPTMAFSAQQDAEEAKIHVYSRTFKASEHLGTHVDAPSHFGGDKNRQMVNELTLKQLAAPAVVVDVSASVKNNPDYLVSPADLNIWEKANGLIPAGTVVIARTGWSARWSQGEPYRNADRQGVMHFPGFSEEAAKRLVERKVAGLGIDTLSVDYGPSTDFKVHHTTQPNGIYHIENMANLDQLPAKGATLIVSPLKLKDGSGSPARIWAIVP